MHICTWPQSKAGNSYYMGEGGGQGRVKEENDGNKRNGTALCWSLNSFGLIALGING